MESPDLYTDDACAELIQKIYDLLRIIYKNEEDIIYFFEYMALNHGTLESVIKKRLVNATSSAAYIWEFPPEEIDQIWNHLNCYFN